MFDLAILRILNDNEAAKLQHKSRMPAVPQKCAFNPFLVRQHVNRQWTQAELKHEPSVFDTYRKGIRDLCDEPIRP
jgi:hypothetical protein